MHDRNATERHRLRCPNGHRRIGPYGDRAGPMAVDGRQVRRFGIGKTSR